MSLVAGGVGAIIALLLSQGFTGLKAFADTNGDTKITGFDSTGKPIDVQLKNNAVVSPQFDFVKIETSELTFPNDNSPNFEFKNNSGVIKRIFALSLIPDTTFKSDGLMKITLNEAPFFPITNQNNGVYADTTAINIPIPDTYGLKILPKEKLKVFIRSPTGATVALTIAVFIGELP